MIQTSKAHNNQGAEKCHKRSQILELATVLCEQMNVAYILIRKVDNTGLASETVGSGQYLHPLSIRNITSK